MAGRRSVRILDAIGPAPLRSSVKRVNRMKAHMRRKLGAALLTGSVLAAAGLHLSGVSLLSADFHGLSGSPVSGGFTGHLRLHWILFVLILAALAGLWLLLISKHEKPRA